MRLAIVMLFAACVCLPAQQQKCAISGQVSDDSGSLVAGGIVKLFGDKGQQEATAGIGGSAKTKGQYTLPQVACPGTYTLQAENQQYKSAQAEKIALTSPNSRVDFVLYPRVWYLNATFLAVFFIFLYLLSIFIFRWHNIAVFDQKQLSAEVAAMRVRLAIEVPHDEASQATVKVLNELLEEAEKPFQRFNLFNWLFWTRGDEISSWGRLREVQRQIVALWPETSIERLRARLESAEQDLRATKTAAALPLADLIRDALLVKAPDIERWKQLLSEGLGEIYGAREDQFGMLTIWQSKSTWLALIACALIQTCITVKGGAILMLMGACGGLLSRLGRALHSNDAPADYGASWTTLFLSPLLGALSGWFGILLITGFTTLKILNPALGDSISFETLTLATLGVAFVLGFSERLFDSLVNAVNDRLLPKDPTVAKPAPPPGAAGAQTTVSGVKPENPAPGDPLIIFGSLLDSSNVDGVKLTHQDTRKEISPAIVKQDLASISFNVPKEAPQGKYTLAVLAKHSANPSATIQVGAEPHMTLLAVTPNPAKPASPVIVPGTLLDQSSTAKVELTDVNKQAVAITALRQSPTAIDFTSPVRPGEYTLTVTPKSGAPLSQRFTVEN